MLNQDITHAISKKEKKISKYQLLILNSLAGTAPGGVGSVSISGFNELITEFT